MQTPATTGLGAFTLLASVALGGCATVDAARERVAGWIMPATTAPTVGAAEHDAIARNLVYTLVQIEGLDPFSTSLAYRAPRTPFGATVLQRLRDAGYGVRIVDAANPAPVVAARLGESISSTGRAIVASLQLGAVTIEREYGSPEGSLVPLSDMRLEGTAADGVVLNDDAVFGDDTRAAFTSLAIAGADAAPALRSLDDIDRLLARVSGPDEGAAPEASRSAFARSVRENLLTRGESNYVELFADYTDLSRDVLIFPRGDIHRLGEENKRRLAKVLERFDPSTDVLSLVGCSHGRTEIPGGNAFLANTRAVRVKEELAFMGMDTANVLDEGCWAPRHRTDRWPSRGVVLTHKRLADG